MNDDVPQWADAGLSQSLPSVRVAGESENTEFKEAFPEQAHRLAKEIAALATSGGGRLFLGVDDAGRVVGLAADTGQRRDELIERACSIARTVKPVPRCSFAFAVQDSNIVLVITVEKPDAPIYYYEYRPYLRDGRRSRPAEPEEVQELVWRHPSSEYKRRLERLRIEGLERQSQESAERLAMISEHLQAQRRRFGGAP